MESQRNNDSTAQRLLKERKMAKCVYCSRQATDLDAVGLDACADHMHEADEYHRSRTGRYPDTPIRRHPVVKALFNIVGPEFAAASDHAYDCTCRICREWWRKMGPDPGTDPPSYGPFGSSLEE